MNADTISSRICIIHYQALETLIPALEKQTTKDNMPFSFQKDPIQAKILTDVGWLKGSVTQSINLQALTKATQQLLPTQHQDLPFLLVNKAVQLVDTPTWELNDKAKEAARCNFCQATHIVVAEQDYQRAFKVFTRLYAKGQQATKYPLHRPYQLVACD